MASNAQVIPLMPRRRGRPPKQAGPATFERLLDAAAAACVEQGYEGATVADVAARAGVTPTAIYNHVGSRDELMVAAARRALAGLADIDTDAGGPFDPAARAAALVRRDLDPGFADSRRLVAELHLASGRHAALAELLGAWHDEQAARWVRRLGGRRTVRLATTKAFFLLLLGACHVGSLGALDAPDAATAAALEGAAMSLFQPGGHP